MDGGDSIREEPMDDKHYASTAQVAKALGVSVTTVKRWVDDEILPAHRTVGGHRKLLMTDVLRMIREGNFPQADLAQLLPRTSVVETTEPGELCETLIRGLESANTELVRSVIHGAYHNGMPLELLADRVISPAMMHIGYAWETGRIGVMHEHRSTQLVVGALYELRAMLRVQVDREKRPVAIGGAPEHDHYILPSLLAELVLLDCGWNAINLGPHTPMSAFQHAIETLYPQLIWISISHLQDAEYFIGKYREFQCIAEQANIPVTIGGRGLIESVHSAMQYTMHGRGLTDLVTFAKTLHRQPQRPKRGRPSHPAERPE